MPNSQSLRWRVTLAILLTVVIFCGIFAGFVAYINMRLQDEFLYASTARELNEYRTAYAIDPAMAPPTTATLDSYLVDSANSPALPASLRNLAPGQHHEIQINNRTYHVGVARLNDKVLILAQDISAVEQRENALGWLMVIAFFLALAAAIVVGYWVARIVIAPVNRLARRVQELPVEQRKTRLAPEFADLEIAVIASAFDSYTARLDAFIERERNFTEDASHELRTPLTVMQNALEVLQRSGAGSDAGLRAFHRMRRTVTRMHNLVNALLLLARESDGEKACPPVNLGDVLNETMQSLEPLVRDSGFVYASDIQNPGWVSAPRATVEIVIGNLLRNALDHAGGGTIRVSIVGQELSIQDSGPGIDTAQQAGVFRRGSTRPGSSGSGIGLYLVRRVCERYGWPLEVTSAPGAGANFRVTFNARAPASPPAV